LLDKPDIKPLDFAAPDLEEIGRSQRLPPRQNQYRTPNVFRSSMTLKTRRYSITWKINSRRKLYAMLAGKITATDQVPNTTAPAFTSAPWVATGVQKFIEVWVMRKCLSISRLNSVLFADFANPFFQDAVL